MRGSRGVAINKTRTRYPSKRRTVEGKEMMEMDRARGENNTIIIFMMREGRDRFNINNERDNKRIDSRGR